MSQHGTVSQTITGVTITVEYDRPTARRRDLKSGIIHWDDYWTPGANWATTLEFDGPVRLNGERIRSGKYSLWMIPGDDEWTVVVNRNSRIYHTQHPDEAEDVLRFKATAAQGAYMDALSFYFPEVGATTTTLNFHWGNIVVPMQFEVNAWPVADLSTEDRARYLGRYEMGDGTVVEVLVENDVLAAAGLPGMDGATIHLVPKGHDTFYYGFFMNGELREIYGTNTELVFVMEGDRATRFELWNGGRVRRSGNYKTN